MKKIAPILLLPLFVLSNLVMAQAQTQNQNQGQQQTKKDLPPVPVVRDLVEEDVQEKRSYILTPRQIELLKEDASKARQANISPYPKGEISKPVSTPMTINPDMTQSPRLVRLSKGMLTTFVFSDYNGNPWFIKSAAFDCNLFDDGTCTGKAATEKKATNILKIWSLHPYSYGNIVIELEELTSPINFILASGQSDETDVTVSARVVGKNPNSKAQLIALNKMPDHDTLMTYFLDGVPPDGAKKLKVVGGQAEAWQVGSALYLRTRASVLSPAFTDHAGSADGMHVYKYNSVFPQLLASISGAATTFYISGF